MKKFKQFFIVFLVLILLFAIVYFYSTRNAHEDFIKGVYLSSKSAIDSWDKNPSETLYEFEDEKFYIRFCEDGDIYSAKKESFLWVRNSIGGFPYKNENSVYCVAIDDDIYIYGVTQRENVQKVFIVDDWLNKKDAKFNGKKINSKNSLCFCVKLHQKQLVSSDLSIVFIDDKNNIISELSETNMIEDKLLESLSDHINFETRTVNNETLLPSSLCFEKEMSEKYFLIYENNTFFLEVFSEGLEIQFYDDFVLLTKTKTITKYLDKVVENYYHESYKLKYNDELIKLKQYVLNEE